MNMNPDFNEIMPRLKLLLFPTADETFVATECPNCDSYLTLMQPDPELPNRLIGACEQCKHWYLIDMIPDANQGSMLRLPDVQVIRNLSQANSSEGISLMDGGQDKDSTGRPEHANPQE